MPIGSILSQIINEANAERNNIINQANQKKEEILRQAKQEAQRFYQEILDKERAVFEAEKQKSIVNARLEGKKQLLTAKQKLIDQVFERLKSEIKKDSFKKKQISQDGTKEVPEDIAFYLNKLRPEFETEIAKILFG